MSDYVEKWLRIAAEEIRADGHAGWGNTCEDGANHIAGLERYIAEIERGKVEALGMAAELEAELARETSAYRAVTDSNVDLGQRILLLEAEKLFFKRQASEALADNDKLRGWIKAVYVEGWNDSKGSFEHDFAEYWDASDAKELLGGGE